MRNPDPEGLQRDRSGSAAASAALVLAALLATGCGAKIESWSFETRAAAEADLTAKTSIPAWLPPGATRIRMVHDPGSGRTWVRFSLGPEGREALKKGLLPLPGDQAATLTIPEPPGADWWFASPAAAGAGFFDGNGRDVPARAHLALERNGDTVWGWELK